MGDLNQLIYAQAVFSGFRGRVLGVGSKDYGNTQPFRNLFPGCDYVGIDLEAGKNVDYVVNLENGLGPIAGQQFDVIIICSVLEHSPRPWVIAEHLQSVLSPEGALMSCHPWVQRYHKYPDDYFRFSPKGVMLLFASLSYWLPVFLQQVLTVNSFLFPRTKTPTMGLLVLTGMGGSVCPICNQ
jgi:hypothetical protein